MKGDSEGVVYTIGELLEMTEYVVRNTHIKAFGNIFRQCHIPFHMIEHYHLVGLQEFVENFNSFSLKFHFHWFTLFELICCHFDI